MRILILAILIFTNIVISQEKEVANKVKKFNVEECINLALKNNPKIKAVRYGEDISESHIKQLESANYPQLDFRLTAMTLDDNPNFIFPSFTMEIDPIDLGGIVIQSDPIKVEEQNIKLMDKFSVLSSVNMQYALWTGGYLAALNSQAETALEISKLQSIKTENEIIAEVKKRYFAVIMLQKLQGVADETSSMLNAALTIMETIYNGGSMTVSTPDYLKYKMYMSFFDTIVDEIVSKNELAKAGLLFSMGLNSNSNFILEEPKSLDSLTVKDYSEIVNLAYNGNPLWKITENAKNIFKYKVDEVNSEYYPRFGIFAGYTNIYNNYEYGMVTPTNKNQWHVGIGMELSIFNGFRTTHKANEEKIKQLQLEEKINELRNGIDILAHKATIEVKTGYKKLLEFRDLLVIAQKNKRIIENAYNNDLVETKDFIEANLYESFILSQLYTAEYNYSIAIVELENIIGKR